LYFENGLIAEVIDNTTSRGRTIRFVFEGDNEELYQKIDEIGQTPLPHTSRGTLSLMIAPDIRPSLPNIAAPLRRPRPGSTSRVISSRPFRGGACRSCRSRSTSD